MQAIVVTITACLSIAVVLGTDVFFTVVGRTALARASDSAVLEVMAHLHAVADRRMPLFGVAGLVGTGLLPAFGPQVRVLAAVSLAAQLLFLALYLTFAKPINVQMISAMRTGTESPDARALQVRWESILVYRSILLGIALCTLLLALTKEG
jgi:Domain of unknown function (DUF1772)